ncbi:MAG: ribosome biogenesis GTP-binding protein YihA/YsxC [Prevotellaceae bacterium]|jgi:GTP-binding protein|nr:ribosome biogenesis GTP-binding protein YihA/YsxC [Prevotellaceae bacterium]
MIIKSAEFLVSNRLAEQCPASQIPEYAFTGRSNVGKSSLINSLTGRKNLAHTSSTPGKTQLINHFLINNQWHLVDLPGYGYARSSKTKRAQFAGSIMQYIRHRGELTLLFVLLDSRLEPQQIDLDFITRLGEYAIPFALVFTKADKTKQRELDKNITQYKTTLLAEWETLPRLFITSAKTGRGREDILKYIEEINASLGK